MRVLPGQSFVESSTLAVEVEGRTRTFFGHTAEDGSQHLWVFRAGGAVEAFPGRDPKSLPTYEGHEGKVLVALVPENWKVEGTSRGGSTLVATEAARGRRRDELRGLGFGSAVAAPAPAPAAAASAAAAFGVPRAPVAGAPVKAAAPAPAPVKAAAPDDPRAVGLLDGTLSQEEAIAGLTLQELEGLVVAVKALKERREREASAKAAAVAALKELLGVVAPVAPAPSAYDDADADADADADDDIGLDDEAPVAGVG